MDVSVGYAGRDKFEPLRRQIDEAMWWPPTHHELGVTVLSQAGLGNEDLVCFGLRRLDAAFQATLAIS